MRLLLISHGSTPALRTAAFPDDEPLDARGLAGAEAARIDSHAGALVLTSPAQRACQTAQAMKLDARVDPLLCDCDFGRWKGQRYSDIQNACPDGLIHWLTDVSAVPHEGESTLQLIHRVQRWLEQRARAGQDCVAITHASVIRAALVVALNAPYESFWRVDVEPLTMANLHYRSGRWTLRGMGLPVTLA